MDFPLLLEQNIFLQLRFHWSWTGTRPRTHSHVIFGNPVVPRDLVSPVGSMALQILSSIELLQMYLGHRKDLVELYSVVMWSYQMDLQEPV